MRSRSARGVPRTAVSARTVSLVTAAAAVPALLIGQAGVAMAAPAAPGIFGQMTSALAAQLSQNVSKPVIVIMRNQFGAAPVGTAAAAARAAQARGSQKGITGELTQVHAKSMHSLSLVNAVTATVSAGEETRLQANPQVAEVIPNVTIKGAPAQAGAAGTAASGRHPGRVRRERRRAAGPGGPVADRHRQRRQGRADGPVAGRHWRGRQGRLHRRRHRPQQRQLHPPRHQHLGVRRRAGLQR
jgi:hypothetical protein